MRGNYSCRPSLRMSKISAAPRLRVRVVYRRGLIPLRKNQESEIIYANYSINYAHPRSPKDVNLPFASGSAAARRPRVRELNPLGGKLSTDPLTSLNTVHHDYKTD